MTDTVRESIMDRLADNLALITVANGYRTDVANVEREITAPDIDDIDFTLCPLIIVAEGPEAMDYEPGKM
ncbi:MAG: hypothetical protein WC483_05720, partial [Candidatus Paceibacterota bacterium]